MNRLLLNGFIAIFGCFTGLFINCELPADPSEDPDNAEVILFTENGVVGHGVVNINVGDSSKVGLRIAYPKHIQTVSVTTSCGVYESTITPDVNKSFDTVYFTPVFTTTGPCSVFVNTSTGNSLTDKADTLAFYIFTGQPGINFIVVPQAYTTQIGSVDTLLFVTKTRGGAGIPAYAVTSTPTLDAAQLNIQYSMLKDTARIIFNPTVAGTYTVFINAIAPVAGAVAVSATSTVEIRVMNSIMPSKVYVPQTIITGTIDTIIFAVDNSNRSDKITMKLVTEQLLDPAVFTILPTGVDSILIRVAPSATDANKTVRFGIATSNGILTDTAWYPITLINQNTALWNTINVTVPAVEGKPVQLDLRPYFIKPQTGTVIFKADIGTVADTTWQWAPAFGCEVSATAAITATKNDTSSLGLHLAIQVTPGDTIKPTLELADKALDGKKVSSPQITVDCIADDKEAGVGKVTIAYGNTSVEAALQHDNVYSGIVSGLASGVPTTITITASDKSMLKNSRAISFTVTYDSAMLDAEPPVIMYVSGPKSGDRVKSAGGTITYSIIDNSGVDSVWWILNGSSAGSIAKSANNEYALVYSLATYGNNAIVIHAQDASKNKNNQTTTVTLNYNTSPTAIASAAPQNNASDIPLAPVFTWTGGIDGDGDTVFYVVAYGTTPNSLTIKTAETLERNVMIAAADKLAANTNYYWKVAAYTKKPYADTVESAVVSFKTAGVPPLITSPPPATAQVTEGATLTLKVEASGVPSPGYQWYRNDTLLPGQTAAELSKANVTASDAGAYHVVVSNGVGSPAISTKTIVSVRFKANITEDPAAATVNEGESVTFTVKAVGEAPLSYQWLRDGAVIGGANSATLSITGATPADGGKNYSCVVSNSFSRDTSASARLTVNATPMYTVSFNVDGGSAIAPQSVKSGQNATKPAADPIKDGFEFDGWYTSNSFSTVFDFSTQSITANCVVYAKWIVIYTATYDKNGGSGSVPIDSRKYKAGETATILGNTGNLTRGGFVFSGWNTNSAGTGTQYDPGSGLLVNGSVLLYARWKRLCSVTFDGDGATTAPSPASAGVTEGATVGTLPTGQAKTGYQFDGWWTGRKGTGTLVSATTVVNGDIVVYAKWIIRDIDNNVYTDVTIGSQTWMVENLRVTKYRDGTQVAGYRVYEDISSNKEKYGALYHGEAVDTANPHKIAPLGWHVPDNNEWETLKSYMIANGYNYDGTNAGNKIGKAMASTTDWNWDNSILPGAVGYDAVTNNESGFNAKPAGAFVSSPTGTSYSGLGNGTGWWSTSYPEGNESYITYFYGLSFNLASFDQGVPFPFQHISIRLIRDY